MAMGVIFCSDFIICPASTRMSERPPENVKTTLNVFLKRVPAGWCHRKKIPLATLALKVYHSLSNLSPGLENRVAYRKCGYDHELERLSKPNQRHTT